MSDQCDLCLLGVIILSSLLTGTSGVDDDDRVFISSGGNVRLSCKNALSDCKSTTWNYYYYYNRFKHLIEVELIIKGIRNEDTERLSLESDCSLNIKNVRKDQYGLYTCRQYVNGRQQGTDAPVYLHVLHVLVSPSSCSSSSSQTEIGPGCSVTLYCQLYSFIRYSCNDRVSSDGVELLWVNQAGVDLKTDSRYKISSSTSSSDPYRCIIFLTTTLLNEDNNREWRCQVTHRNQLQASVTYTVKYSGDVSEHSSSAAPVSSTTLTPDTTTNSLNPVVTTLTTSTPVTALPTANSPNPVVTTTTSTTVTGLPTAKSLNPGLVAVIVIVAASFALALILWVIRKKRSGNRRGTGDSVEQTDDVTYTEVAAYSKK